jgi:GTP-binding protein HflX
VVINKGDLLPEGGEPALRTGRPEAVVVSALTGAGLDDLRAAVRRRMELGARAVRLRFAAKDARAIAGVYSAGRVTAHEVNGDEVTIDAELPERLVDRYREHIV